MENKHNYYIATFSRADPMSDEHQVIQFGIKVKALGDAFREVHHIMSRMAFHEDDLIGIRAYKDRDDHAYFMKFMDESSDNDCFGYWTRALMISSYNASLHGTE